MTLNWSFIFNYRLDYDVNNFVNIAFSACVPFIADFIQTYTYKNT